MAKKKTIIVTYSYREYVEREIKVPADLDTGDEDAVRDALDALGHTFSDDEEWQLDYAEEVEQ